MPNESILPTSIRLSARPGETVRQDFVVQRPVGTGALIATIEGDDLFIRLSEFVAYDFVRERVSDEEFALLPPHLQDEAHRFSTTIREAARVGPNTRLPVRPGQRVFGVVECASPATATFSHHTARLVIDGFGTDRVEVPLVFVVGDLLVEFLVNPIVARQYQFTELPVRVTLPGAPATDVTLGTTHNFVEIPRKLVHVPKGGSATATLDLRAAPNAPLGPLTTLLNIERDSNRIDHLSFDLIVEPPSHPPQLDPALVVDLIHQHYQRTGGRLGPLGYPISEVQFTSNSGTRQYRGGRIEATLNARNAVGVITQALKTRESRVTFLGFKCIKESTSDGLSDTDEPYFVIAIDTGNGLPRTEKFGPFENTETGTETGVGVFLANGIAPNPLSIRAQAYENDHGDPDETAKALQQQIVELAKVAQSTASGSGADAADGPGIGPAATAGAVGLLAGPLGSLLAVGIVSVLGLGDDWIGQGVVLAFTRPEQGGTPQQQGMFQNNPYNAKIDINGGSEGHYELYFDIHVVEFEPITV